MAVLSLLLIAAVPSLAAPASRSDRLYALVSAQREALAAEGGVVEACARKPESALTIGATTEGLWVYCRSAGLYFDRAHLIPVETLKDAEIGVDPVFVGVLDHAVGGLAGRGRLAVLTDRSPRTPGFIGHEDLRAAAELLRRLRARTRDRIGASERIGALAAAPDFRR